MVYVDALTVWPNARNACFKHGSAHLTADTLDELHAFAKRIGLKRAWFQDHRVAPHYDLSPFRHALALSLGAVLVPMREQLRRRRTDAIERAFAATKAETEGGGG